MLATVTQIYWLGLKRQRQGDYWPTEQQFLMWEVLHPRGHFGNVRGHCLTGVMTEEVLLAFSRHGPKKLDVLQIPGPSCMTKHPTCSLIFSDLWGNNLFKMIWAKNLTVLHRNIKYWGLRLHNPDAGGSDSIPGQGTRSHMLQPRIHMPQLKMLHAATKMEDPTNKTNSTQKKKKKKFFLKYILPSINMHCISKVTIAMMLKTDCFASNLTVLVTHMRKSCHQATLFVRFKSPIQRSWHIVHLWLWSPWATCKNIWWFCSVPCMIVLRYLLNGIFYCTDFPETVQ